MARRVEIQTDLYGGPNKPIVLVPDGAGWCRSDQLPIPQGIHLLFLPPYASELQPCERLWPLTNEPLANRCFATLDDLEQVQAQRCRWLQAQPIRIRFPYPLRSKMTAGIWRLVFR